MNIDDIAARVRGGAVHLDENHPGWHEQINMNLFDANSAIWDAYAQTVRQTIPGLIHDDPDAAVWAYRHGFLAEDGEEDQINECWLTEINDRLNGTTAFDLLCEAAG